MAYYHLARKRGRPRQSITALPLKRRQNLLDGLYANGDLSTDEYSSGVRYQALHRQYLTSINAPALSKSHWHSLGQRFRQQYGLTPTIEAEHDIVVKDKWHTTQNCLKQKLGRELDIFQEYLRLDVSLKNNLTATALLERHLDIIKKGLNCLLRL